jgi:hypothetical protein
LTNRIDVAEGDKFKVSFWIKNSGCKFVVKIGVPGGEMNWKNIVDTKKDLPEWTFFEEDYTVPEHFPFFLFELNILSPGTFWIDDVRIEKTEQ